MTQHTPGPWTATEHYITAAAHHGFTVADVDTFSGQSVCPTDERRANARLIAAAPELLVALERLLFCCIHGNGSETWGKVKDKAAAAIAKANGEPTPGLRYEEPEPGFSDHHGY